MKKIEAKNSFDLAKKIIDLPLSDENRRSDIEAWAACDFKSPVCPPEYCLHTAKFDPEVNSDMIMMMEDFPHIKYLADNLSDTKFDWNFVLLKDSPYHHGHFWKDFDGQIKPGDIYSLKSAGIFDPPVWSADTRERWRMIYNAARPLFVVASGPVKNGYFAAMPIVLNRSEMYFWFPSWLPRAEVYPGIDSSFAAYYNFDNLSEGYIADVCVFVPVDHVLERVGWLRGETPVELFGGDEHGAPSVFVPDPSNNDSLENSKRLMRLRLFLMWMDAKDYQRRPKPF